MRQRPLAFHLFSNFPRAPSAATTKINKKYKEKSQRIFPFCLWKNFIYSPVCRAKDFKTLAMQLCLSYCWIIETFMNMLNMKGLQTKIPFHVYLEKKFARAQILSRELRHFKSYDGMLVKISLPARKKWLNLYYNILTSVRQVAYICYWNSKRQTVVKLLKLLAYRTYDFCLRICDNVEQFCSFVYLSHS